MKSLRASHYFLLTSWGASLASCFWSFTKRGEVVVSRDVPLRDMAPSQLRLVTGARPNRRTVVIYTGPTELDEDVGKNWIYLANFDYFLENGIQCHHGQDTIVVVSKQVQACYQTRLDQIDEHCRKVSSHSNPFRVVVRENRCYDMESLRVVFDGVDLFPYDYLVYLNCGVVGPKVPSPPNHTAVVNLIANATKAISRKLSESYVEPIWTERYTSLLDDTYKMSGLTVNCANHVHIQSMVFAVDRVGLDIIQKSGAVYDCNMTNDQLKKQVRKDFIDRYEVGMSRAILQAGYGIRSTHSTGRKKFLPSDLPQVTEKTCTDLWSPKEGRFESWEDLMFFKTSRLFLLPEIQAAVQYDDEDEFKVVIPII